MFSKSNEKYRKYKQNFKFSLQVTDAFHCSNFHKTCSCCTNFYTKLHKNIANSFTDISDRETDGHGLHTVILSYSIKIFWKCL